MENVTSSEDFLSYTDDTNFQRFNGSESPNLVKILPSLLFSAVGLIANTLVIIVIVTGSLRHMVFMLILMILAITDIFTLCTLNLSLRELFGRIFGKSVLSCRILSFLAPCSGLFSSWLIVLIAAERFTAVLLPLKVHIYFTLKRSYILMVVLAVISCISSVSYLFPLNVDVMDRFPYCQLGASVNIGLARTILSVSLYSILPFSIITILNILIVRKLRSKPKFHLPNPKQVSSRDKSLVLMMFAICTVFAVTTFPISLSMIFSSAIHHVNLSKGTAFSEWFYVFSLVLANINHSVNFFFYCITGTVFRKALFRLFRCNRGQNNNPHQHATAISENIL